MPVGNEILKPAPSRIEKNPLVNRGVSSALFRSRLHPQSEPLAQPSPVITLEDTNIPGLRNQEEVTDIIERALGDEKLQRTVEKNLALAGSAERALERIGIARKATEKIQQINETELEKFAEELGVGTKDSKEPGAIKGAVLATAGAVVTTLLPACNPSNPVAVNPDNPPVVVPDNTAPPTVETTDPPIVETTQPPENQEPKIEIRSTGQIYDGDHPAALWLLWEPEYISGIGMRAYTAPLVTKIYEDKLKTDYGSFDGWFIDLAFKKGGEVTIVKIFLGSENKLISRTEIKSGNLPRDPQRVGDTLETVSVTVKEFVDPVNPRGIKAGDQVGLGIDYDYEYEIPKDYRFTIPLLENNKKLVDFLMGKANNLDSSLIFHSFDFYS